MAKELRDGIYTDYVLGEDVRGHTRVVVNVQSEGTTLAEAKDNMLKKSWRMFLSKSEMARTGIFEISIPAPIPNFKTFILISFP